MRMTDAKFNQMVIEMEYFKLSKKKNDIWTLNIQTKDGSNLGLNLESLRSSQTKPYLKAQVMFMCVSESVYDIDKLSRT
jgi:hypothetical protein